jgi:hypothetical protein
MRYVLPAFSVSGPSGKRARRREPARLARRQGAARRSGKTRPAVVPPRLPESFFALRVLVVPANAAVLSKQQATELPQEFCTHQGGRPKLISEGTGVRGVDPFSVGIDVASFSKVRLSF